ncbi:hypothetical protein Ga0074812_101229 [Parafrankia irregularis]|uniref:Uncharacterized protein n=1 Tax=Parafrankia irregularis TaxID=795642 RepID=A0A0S4QE29_9ACTN|nr:MULTISPECIES: DUF5701 family protein [Parafrankia]MBE3199601.1 hypothetical protein [Parafrankia sp. CH37]CUU53731.1 hypothetical protein Ga0074812_101229 [Parafrankia irregularis]
MPSRAATLSTAARSASFDPGADGSAAWADPLDQAFNRQVAGLVRLGYPALAGLEATDFEALCEPLRTVAHAAMPGPYRPATRSWVPFVLVVSEELVRAEDIVPLLTLSGRADAGTVDRNHGEGGLAPYRPLPILNLPRSDVYLLTDVERGEEFRGIRPADALPAVLERRRTPLTIHEGIALVTHFPEVLEKNNCFMLSGSRRGDRRVPAMWISGRAPKLGWCWEGNPHTWLGTASAAARHA